VPAPLHDVQTLLVVLAFVVMGRFLIPPWTSTELLRFVSFVSLASGVGLFFAQVARRPAIRVAAVRKTVPHCSRRMRLRAHGRR
jgi:hypothetical protein